MARHFVPAGGHAGGLPLRQCAGEIFLVLSGGFGPRAPFRPCPLGLQSWPPVLGLPFVLMLLFFVLCAPFLFAIMSVVLSFLFLLSFLIICLFRSFFVPFFCSFVNCVSTPIFFLVGVLAAGVWAGR